MSGQTYETIIETPRDRALATVRASAARQSGGATALSAEEVQRAIAGVARLVTGSVRRVDRATVAFECHVRNARVAVEVATEAPDRTRVRFGFAHAVGLTCAEEAQIAAELTARLAEAGLRPTAPTAGARAARPVTAGQEGRSRWPR